jgi:23S rRNA pseudouridine1911/1915/1917 synthase
VTVDQPLGDDTSSPVFMKSAVRPDGQPAVTHFTPIQTAGGFTLARVVTETGRKHQIRAHAQWLGHALVGDKIYGPDARLLSRLHRPRLDGGAGGEAAAAAAGAALCGDRPAGWRDCRSVFTAPLPEDLRAFCASRGLSA